MKVPFLDLQAQYRSIKQEVDPAIHQVLDSSAYILGKAVSDFEAAFATAHSVKYCLGVSSGTAGNHMVLWALGLGPGDEVIIPANTFIATAWGATLCGATPVFVDCEALSYNIDPAKVEAAITKKTKAIVAVHLYGQPADMDSLRAIAKKHKLHLVEDCAQAHIAEYKGKPVGGLADASSFSYYPGKNLGAYGEGGAVATNDDGLAQRFKMIRDHGAQQKYQHEIYGHNYRMEGIQGAVLGVKLKHLSSWTDARRSVAAKYKTRLADCVGIIVPAEMPYAKHVYHLFVIQVREGGSERRDRLVKHLNEQEISTGLHYPVPLHQQKCFASLGYRQGQFLATERLASHGLSLPMFAELADQQIEHVCNSIRSFFTAGN